MAGAAAGLGVEERIAPLQAMAGDAAGAVEVAAADELQVPEVLSAPSVLANCITVLIQ
jgi:hypothetical protein